MDRNIQIEIKDRVAHLVGNPKIICGNNDYSVTFTFDDEWTGVDVKTLRVSYNNKYSDHVFSGDRVELPPIIKAVEVYLGVFAGDITSTKVAVRAEPSILCAGGSVADPEPDVYAQIIDLVNTGKLKGDPGEPGKDAVPYILPTATATTKGGVKIGKGLQMDGDVLSGIEAVNMELIWENAIPGSGFVEQAIPLDLSRAKVIFLQAQNNVTGGGYLLSYGPFPKNETCIIERNVETNVFTRKFTATDVGVYFLNSNLGANYLVPLKIWAIFE